MNTVDENRVAKKKQSGKIRKKGQIDWMITLLPLDRKSTRLISSHTQKSRMPSSA